MITFLIIQALKKKLYIKYIIAGGTATVVDLIILFLLTEIIGLWYLISAVIAFIVAFFVSFFLQKFWTFRDNNKEKIFKQMGMYLSVGLMNLIINTIGMYVLVDKFDLMYMIAQIIMICLVAISSFLIYRYIIFKKDNFQTQK